MKNLYTSIVLLVIFSTSFAQNNNDATSIITPETIVLVSSENNIIENPTETKNDEFRYYYFPNLYAYYDLETNEYIFKINDEWHVSEKLPSCYGGYSLFKNAKIPIKDYLGDNPQDNIKDHKKQYPYIKKSRMLKSLVNGDESITSIN